MNLDDSDVPLPSPSEARRELEHPSTQYEILSPRRNQGNGGLTSTLAPTPERKACSPQMISQFLIKLSFKLPPQEFPTESADSPATYHSLGRYVLSSQKDHYSPASWYC